MADSFDEFDALLARIVQRCQQLGRSQRDVLKSARLSDDFLWKGRPMGGHRLDAFAKIARELEWTLSELFDETDTPPEAEQEFLIRIVNGVPSVRKVRICSIEGKETTVLVELIISNDGIEVNVIPQKRPTR